MVLKDKVKETIVASTPRQGPEHSINVWSSHQSIPLAGMLFVLGFNSSLVVLPFSIRATNY